MRTIVLWAMSFKEDIAEDTMKIELDNLWLCSDCLIAAVNGDFTGLDYYYSEPEATERMNAITAGLDELGPYLVPSYDSETNEGIEEFSNCTCDCCHTRLAGSRHRFATLTEGD